MDVDHYEELGLGGFGLGQLTGGSGRVVGHFENDATYGLGLIERSNLGPGISSGWVSLASCWRGLFALAASAKAATRKKKGFIGEASKSRPLFNERLSTKSVVRKEEILR